MENREKLLTLLQPNDYKSKLKLFCRGKNLEVKKYNEIFAQVKLNFFVAKKNLKQKISQKKLHKSKIITIFANEERVLK